MIIVSLYHVPVGHDKMLFADLLIIQRKAVDAVAQACGLRAVFEDVAQMRAAIRAVHFGSGHQ